MAVDVVVLGGEGEPRTLGAHQLARVGVGVRGEGRAAGEVPRAAPLESGVAGHLTARGGRGAEGQRLGTRVGEADRPVQGPGAGLLVHRVDGQAAYLTRPLLAAVLDPGELLGEGEAVVLDGEVGEAVVPHRADALGQGQIALSVDVAVAAPEVLAGQMARGHLEALVPAVVVRAVAGDRAAGQGAHGMGVRLAGLERIRVGAVDVAGISVPLAAVTAMSSPCVWVTRMVMRAPWGPSRGTRRASPRRRGRRGRSPPPSRSGR